MSGVFPIWKRDTRELSRQMIAMGFKAILSCVEGKVGPGFVGRAYDERLLSDLPDGIDPCGEYGEFHSFVYDGPGFRKARAGGGGRNRDPGWAALRGPASCGSGRDGILCGGRHPAGMSNEIVLIGIGRHDMNKRSIVLIGNCPGGGAGEADAASAERDADRGDGPVRRSLFCQSEDGLPAAAGGDAAQRCRAGDYPLWPVETPWHPAGRLRLHPGDDGARAVHPGSAFGVAGGRGHVSRVAVVFPGDEFCRMGDDAHVPTHGIGTGALLREGIPYFGNNLAGDVAFTSVLFGGLAWLENRVAWMREKAPSVLA